MTVSKAPRDYDQWRSDDSGRAEDAAYTFGFHLITNCRDEAMATIPKNATPEMVEAIQQAVDTALHNVCDMLEGFWKLEAGPRHTIELALVVEVHDENGEPVESQRISPCVHDLPIGYWKWAREREFQ